MPTCVEGHATEATDYCDVCGSPVTTRRRNRFPRPGVREGLPVVRRADQRPLL